MQVHGPDLTLQSGLSAQVSHPVKAAFTGVYTAFSCRVVHAPLAPSDFGSADNPRSGCGPPAQSDAL